jgi:hypothetical protein
MMHKTLLINGEDINSGMAYKIKEDNLQFDGVICR